MRPPPLPAAPRLLSARGRRVARESARTCTENVVKHLVRRTCSVDWFEVFSSGFKLARVVMVFEEGFRPGQSKHLEVA